MIIRGGRGSGKTTKLIKMSAETGYHILCCDKTRADHIYRTAFDLNLFIPGPLVVDDINRFYRPGVKGILIDDIEDVLKTILRVPVKCMSTSDKVFELTGGHDND